MAEEEFSLAKNDLDSFGVDGIVETGDANNASEWSRQPENGSDQDLLRSQQIVALNELLLSVATERLDRPSLADLASLISAPAFSLLAAIWKRHASPF